jgi:hypothetical protein
MCGVQRVRQVHTAIDGTRDASGALRIGGGCLCCPMLQGKSDRYHCRLRRLQHDLHNAYGIESARNMRSYEAADGCTVLMKEVPAPRGRTCKATASAKHSAL